MGRDYASQPKRKAQVRSGNPPVPGWVWLVCGLCVGLCFAVAVYIVMRPPPPAGHPPAAPTARATPPAEPQIPPAEKPRFKFYELLPNFEIVPRGDNYVVEKEPARPGTYLIQAGAFKKREDAERRKANIALLGIESRIEKVTIDGQGTHYRIRIGPQTDFEAVKQTMRQLASNDIETFFIRTAD